jgi:hypothetical protein
MSQQFITAFHGHPPTFGLAVFGKTISAQQNFDGLHVWDKSGRPSQDAQKGQTSHPPNPGGYFTRPP